MPVSGMMTHFGVIMTPCQGKWEKKLLRSRSVRLPRLKSVMWSVCNYKQQTDHMYV